VEGCALGRRACGVRHHARISLTLPFAPPLPLRTERLVIRAYTPADLEAVLAYQSLPEVGRYIPWQPRTRESMPAIMDRKVGATTLAKDDDVLELAVTLADDGRVIGEVLLFLRSAAHENGEVGWALDPAHQGHGYATEAAREILRLAFEDAGMRRVTARIEKRNVASQRVCERLGMRREAELVENEWLNGELSTEVDYALLEREWRERPAGPATRAAARGAAAPR
jgi:RimJ/RimL family protein N-acetyltransferase